MYDLCRIGTEHEKFGFEFETLRPIKYKQISALLNGIAARFDWDKIMEGYNIIGLKNVGPSIIILLVFNFCFLYQILCLAHWVLNLELCVTFYII